MDRRRAPRSNRSGRPNRPNRPSGPRRTGPNARNTAQNLTNTMRGSSGNSPVRIKKSQTLGGAIMGVFLGILLLLGSPVALWYAETQHSAKDFVSATQVDASTVQDGYVTFQDSVDVTSPLACGENGVDCLYYTLDKQELVPVQKEQCGNVSSDAEILYETVLECDEDNNCQQCYMVEVEEWQTFESDSQGLSVGVGSYDVEFNSSAIMFGSQTETVQQGQYLRDVWTYFPVPTELRVAGNATSGNVSGGGEKVYVLSSYDYAGTLEQLEARDATFKWILRAVTFFMLVAGFGGILGPIRYFSHVARKIPFVGPIIKDAGGAIIGLISFLLAIVAFVVIWVAVTIFKNIVILIIGIVVIGALVGIYTMKKKGDDKDEKKEKKK